jgi:hypothetical protein
MVDGAFLKYTHFFSRLNHIMVHEVPLRQKEAYAPPWMQHRLNIHNDIRPLAQKQEKDIQTQSKYWKHI